MQYIRFIVATVFAASVFGYASGDYHDGFSYMADFGVDKIATVFWAPGKKDDDWIRFEIQAKIVAGWLGIGLSPTGAMRGADIAVMWFDEFGSPQISDRHGPTAETNAYPPIDQQQDYEIVAANTNTTHSIFQIKRRMKTCDDNDWPITSDTVHMLFAYGVTRPSSAVDLTKHENKFSKSVRLIGHDDRDRIDRIFNSPGVFPYEFSSGGVKIPSNTDTLYFCRVFELKKYSRPLQVIGYDMKVQNGNEQIVHHANLYGCRGDLSQFIDKPGPCFEGEFQFMDLCKDTFNGWAIGGEPFAYPDDKGLRYFGEEYDYFAMEFHYDNSRLVKNVTDNSSFQVYLTEKLRPIEIGTIILGSYSSSFSTIIPPKQERFKHYAYCPSNCSQKLENKTMNIISGFLHSHLAGRAMRVRHIRNGLELPPLIEDNFYDFNYQSPISIEDRQFIAGDELILECEYGTMDRERTTTGGLSTHHEMCVALIEYYPRNRFMEQRCMSNMNRNGLPALFGATNATEMDDPDETWIIDSAANGGELIEKMQAYVRDNPHECDCKINNDNEPEQDSYFWMKSNPAPRVPYRPAVDNCTRMTATDKPTGGDAKRQTLTRWLIVSIAIFSASKAL